MPETRMQEWAEELAELARQEHGPSFHVPRVILTSEEIAEGKRAEVERPLVKRPLMDSFPIFRTTRGGIRFQVPFDFKSQVSDA